MNIHEYQAKQILAQYGLPIPNGKAAKTLDDALSFVNNDFDRGWVIKAQVHAGGRGKAGGVKLVSNKAEFTETIHALLGTRLVTYQTDEKGQPVNELLIEETCKIANELYIGAVIERSEKKLVIMASTEGGVEIEKVASETPEKIIRASIDPFIGVMPYQARELGYQLGLNKEQMKQFVPMIMNLGKMFFERDLSLLEINPLVITEAGDLLCLDAKINIDENALYRQPELREMRDVSQEDERENKAKEWDLSYIALDGDIGCMVNGAGLAMATMDLVKLNDGHSLTQELNDLRDCPNQGLDPATLILFDFLQIVYVGINILA